jgi:hypothetical protein
MNGSEKNVLFLEKKETRAGVILQMYFGRFS